MVHWINCAIFDIIGDLSWGKSFDCVELDQPPALLSVLLHFKATVTATCIAHYGKFLMSWLTPKSVLMQLQHIFATGQQRISERTAMSAPARRDIMSYMLQSFQEEKEALSLSHGEMEHSSLTIILAGSEPVTSTISATVALLLAHPQHLQTLTREIRSAFTSMEDISSRRAAELPFLHAVLCETMRVYPAIPDGLRRQVPVGGAVVAGEPLPAGVTVAMACYSMFHSERNFTDCDVFAPERWRNRSDVDVQARFPVHSVEAYQPFAAGSHNCIGKSLAWLEMRLFLSMLLWRYDLEVPKGEVVLSWANQNIWWTWEKRPLRVQLARAQ